MGRRIEDFVILKRFMSNIVWLNLKRFKHHILWRLILICINFMMLFSTIISQNVFLVIYILIMTAFMNVLFVIIRTNSESDSISLLRSFGASRLFIIFDNLLDVLLEILIAVLLFCLIIPFLKPPLLFLFLIIIQLAVVSLVTPFYSYLTLYNMEKHNKEI
jgi:hypothetical protein